MTEALFKAISNSNFKVLKCYKIAFSIEKIFQNIGRIIMTLILFVFIILLIIYSSKNRKKINKFLNQILEKKLRPKDKKIGKTFKNYKYFKSHLEEEKYHGYTNSNNKKISEFNNEKERLESLIKKRKLVN